MTNEKYIINLIKSYCSKARCFHSKGKSLSILNTLKNRLTDKQINKLEHALWHKELGGADLLDEINKDPEGFYHDR